MHVLIRLLTFLRPYKRRVLLAWLCVCGSSAFVLVSPQLVRWAIDTGLQVRIQGVNSAAGSSVALGSTHTLVIASLAIVAAAGARGVFAYGQTYLAEWVSQRVAYDLRNAIYDHLQRLSYAYHDRAQTGQLMSRATQDVEGVRMYISMGVLRLLYLVILLLAVLGLMLAANWQLALVSWAFLPPIAWLSAANSSCSSRLMPYLAAMFSAVTPMWTCVIGQVSPSAIIESSSSSCPMRTPKRAFFRM